MFKFITIAAVIFLFYNSCSDEDNRPTQLEGKYNGIVLTNVDSSSISFNLSIGKDMGDIKFTDINGTQTSGQVWEISGEMNYKDFDNINYTGATIVHDNEGTFVEFSSQKTKNKKFYLHQTQVINNSMNGFCKIDSLSGESVVNTESGTFSVFKE